MLLVLLAAGAVAAAAADPEGTCLKGDCENGQGTYQSADGDRYAGQWVAGLPSGTGTYSYDDGSVYIGEFKAGLFDGQGQATFVTQDRSGHDRYARQNFAIRRALLWIACGAPCAWILTAVFPPGCSAVPWQVGQWKDNTRHGQGVMTWADGSKFEGEWREGKINGEGVQHFVSGDKYEASIQYLQNTFQIERAAVCSAMARILIPAGVLCGFLTGRVARRRDARHRRAHVHGRIALRGPVQAPR